MSQPQSPSSDASEQNDELTRAEQLEQRDDSDIARNHGADSFHSALGLLQNIPDVEIEFNSSMNNWLRVKRQGITYGINTRCGPSTKGKLGRYVYAVGADLGDGLEFPVLTGNSFGSYVEAVTTLYKCILQDPRQDGIPRELYRTHFTVHVPVAARKD